MAAQRHQARPCEQVFGAEHWHDPQLTGGQQCSTEPLQLPAHVTASMSDRRAQHRAACAASHISMSRYVVLAAAQLIEQQHQLLPSKAHMLQESLQQRRMLLSSV